MARFGWCMDGFHEGRVLRWATPCPGVAAGLVCGCSCHGHESQDESTAARDLGPTTQPMECQTFYAHESMPGVWQVLGPTGPTKVSGATAWETQEAAEKAAATANRRKVARHA